MPNPITLEVSCFPCGPDKRPLVAGGFKSAVSGHDRINDLFRRFPGALVGMPTGEASGIDVLDIDRGGEDWLVEYECAHGLPPTRVVSTRSGGVHFYFRHHEGMRCSAGLIAPCVDIRSTGGYVILWDRAGLPVLSSAEIAPWPGPMLQLLHEATEARRPAEKPPLCGTPMDAAWQPSQGPHEVPKPLYRKVCRLMKGSRLRDQRRVLGLLGVLVEKSDGRNYALNTIGFAFRELIGAGVIGRADVEGLLIEAATLNGYIEKRGRDAADRTIRSGLGPIED
jgi:putative DNA primase/helicase